MLHVTTAGVFSGVVFVDDVMARFERRENGDVQRNLLGGIAWNRSGRELAVYSVIHRRAARWRSLLSTIALLVIMVAGDIATLCAVLSLQSGSMYDK